MLLAGVAEAAPDAGPRKTTPQPAPPRAVPAPEKATPASKPVPPASAPVVSPLVPPASAPTSPKAPAQGATTPPQEVESLEAAQKLLAALRPDQLAPSEAQRKLLPRPLEDPKVVAARIAELDALLPRLRQRAKKGAEQLALLEPLLRQPAERLAAWIKKPPPAAKPRPWTKRGPPPPPVALTPPPPPAKLVAQAAAASERLTSLRLQQRLHQTRLALHESELTYLRASQPARSKASQDDIEARARAARERAALETEQKKALAEQQAAEISQRKALEAQLNARTAAERLLSSERVRLQKNRGAQAKLRSALLSERRAVRRQSDAWQKERTKVRLELQTLSKSGAKPAAFDKVYDEVVGKLQPLRVQARDQLWLAVRGGPSTPTPDSPPSELRTLPEFYQSDVKALRKLYGQLDEEADKLGELQGKLLHEKLVALHDEVDWLNKRRLALLPLMSAKRRDALVGLSKAMIRQATREVTQLVFDAVYWSYSRLRQVREIPRMIYDIFTVGSALVRALKVLFFVWLLFFVQKRWDGWMQLAVRTLGRSLSLGRFAVPLAKLADALRHAGPSLLVLILAAVLFRLLGGPGGPSELRVAYELIFWISIYRLQLRLVESGAKYTGMEDALRGAEGEELFEEEEEELEGPPVPRAVRLAQLTQKSGVAVAKIVPASVLLVRSVRAATRYLLTIVLLLRLTELAAGRGTIYGLTVELYWWAAAPFVIYFLSLWRPHIARAYRTRVLADSKAEGRQKRRPEGTESMLARLVDTTQNRWYGVFVIAAAFVVVLGNRLASFARRYLSSLDATKKLLAFVFRRQVEKHAQQRGHVVVKRQDLPSDLLTSLPLEPLMPNDRLIRQTFNDDIKQVYDNWQAEHSDGSLVLVGRAGMGKTTVLRALDSELGVKVLHGDPKVKITRPAKVVAWLSEVFGFSPKASSERDLVRMILEDTRPVVAIDNCHNLFLRNVGGFDGWEAFIRIVNETCHNVLWVLAFNQAAWDYLHNTSGRVHYFRRVLQLPPWSEDEIRRLVMMRTRRARYRVSFSDLVVTELEGASVSAQIGRTSQGYFRLLWDFTGGNPRLSSHFWLDSLVPDGPRSLRVHLFATPPIEQLEKLPDDIIFVLTAITEHENLSIDETARTTNLPHDFCAFACRFCLESGFLVLDKETRRMRLSMRWQRSILRFLKRKHLLRE